MPTEEGSRVMRSRRNGLGDSDRAFRRAVVCGFVAPLLLLTFGYLFIAKGVEPTCLRHSGDLGACDPLHDANLVNAVGQVAIIAWVAIAVIVSRKAKPTITCYTAMACSIAWAGLTCGFFAAQWLSPNPGAFFGA